MFICWAELRGVRSWAKMGGAGDGRRSYSFLEGGSNGGLPSRFLFAERSLEEFGAAELGAVFVFF